MLRLIVRTVDEAGACNVGSPVDVKHKTFDVRDSSDLINLEKYLLEPENSNWKYVIRRIVGFEIKS